MTTITGETQAKAGIHPPCQTRRQGLWLPLSLGVMVFVLQCRVIHDVDVFWQLRLGEMALARGGPIDHEPFSATHAGEPLVQLAWLGQVVFAGVFRLGGWPVLQAFDALVWASAFFVVGRSAQRTWASTGAAAIALGLGFVASVPFASVRPQTFAVFAFGLLLAIMQSQLKTPRKLLLAAPLLVLWQNLHPSVSVAAVAAAGAAAAGWARLLIDRRAARPWAESWLIVLAGAAMIATPAGLRLFEVSAYNAEISRRLDVSEWLPLWNSANSSASFPAWAALAATAVLLLRRWKQIRAEDLGRAAVLGVMMLAAYRFSPFWALAMIPVWASMLAPSRSLSSNEIKTDRPPAVAPHSPLKAVLAGGLFTSLAIAMAAFVRPRLFAEYLPLDGIDRLRKERISGVVYCHPAWGGPLIGAGRPDWKVAYDGRYYVYSWEEWQRYFNVASGNVTLRELDRLYQPAAYFLRPTVEAGLIAELRQHSDWVEIHSDAQCTVFVRRTDNMLSARESHSSGLSAIK
jgi:hypothetical protein